jgi:hypothetical protein
VSLFSFQGMKDITDWVIDTYYRHYKLYQVRPSDTNKPSHIQQK